MRENVTLREILMSAFGVLILIVVICVFIGMFKNPSISNNNNTKTTSSSVATSSNIKTDTSNAKVETKVNTEPNLKIIKKDMKSTYSSDYRDINITVQNNGTDNINYVKINLFFKDDSGNIIKSEWTNDSSCIKPNATQVITKMVKQDGWYSVNAEIESYH